MTRDQRNLVTLEVIKFWRHLTLTFIHHYSP